jgi:rfaE bifunctional protein kinase chain/domain
MKSTELFEHFKGKRILVLGDVMLDAYLRGKVNRISPEAPVPIVSLEKEEDRLGGAANVAINLVALGAAPILCSIVGDDKEGLRFLNLVKDASIDTKGIVVSNNRITTVKTRVIGNNQQLLRIDSEQTHALHQDEETAIIQRVKELLETGLDAIIFEDYNKGVLTEKVISEVIKLAQNYNVVTTVDPKKDNFLAYKNVTLFKPNLKELKEGLSLEFDYEKEYPSFLNAIATLKSHLNNQISFVTLSEHGVFIQQEAEQFHETAHLRTIADVSGAGDTVISVATLCLVAGLPIQRIAQIANIAGGLVCETSGVVSIDSEQLKSEITNLIGEI